MADSLPPPPPAPPAPVYLEFTTPETIDRWRPFVQWIMAIPHLVIAAALSYASRAVSVISWFVILFTGKLPAGLANFQCMYLRYDTRALSYAGFLRVAYPPFAFENSPADPGDDPPVRLDLAPVLENRNRVTVAFRLILAIPHYLALVVLGIGAVVAIIGSAFAILFTGSWPDGMRRYIVDVARWATRVEAYMTLLHDEYPPFSLD